METTRNRWLAIAIAAALLVAAAFTWVSVGSSATAASATPVVYIATGENFPDALGGGPPAALAKGPILLVQQDAIPAATAGELARLSPDKIVIIGGTAVVSTNVENALKAYAPTVERIAGANRYDTAAKLSASVFPATINADTLGGRSAADFLGKTEKAADSDLLDGMDSSLLASRADGAASTNLPDGTGGVQGLLATSITAPARGVLLMNATVDSYGGPDTFACWIQIDTSVVGGSVMFVDLDNAGNSEEDCTTVAGANVEAGTYVIWLATDASTSTLFEDGTLTVLWVPFDGTGATPASITSLSSVDDIGREG